MTGFVVAILLVFGPVIPPAATAHVAAASIGRPDIADDLTAICHRESRCTRVGPHEIDAHLSSRGWWSQTKLGHLDPECQPRRAPGGWATRGAFGLSAASHWQYLPECYEPRLLDIPIVSALVAAQKYVRRCNGKRGGWCRVPRSVRRDNARQSV